MMQSHMQRVASAHKPEDVTTVITDEVHNRSVQGDYALTLTLLAMQMSSRISLVLMGATGDHDLVKNATPQCHKIVFTGATRKIHQIFLSQPIQRADHLLFTTSQIIIAKHNERAGLPLVDHTSRTDGRVNPCNSSWSLYQEFLRSSSFMRFEAPDEIQSCWNDLGSPRKASSCIICTNVAESDVTIPNVGVVISSGVHCRVSVDVRTGVTIDALQTLSKSQMTQQRGRIGRTDEGDHVTMMSYEQKRIK